MEGDEEEAEVEVVVVEEEEVVVVDEEEVVVDEEEEVDAGASSFRGASAVVLSCASEAADADAPAASAAAAAALMRLGFDEVVQDEENERGECRRNRGRGGNRGGGDDDGDGKINGVRVAFAPPRQEDSVLACIPARERRERRPRSCCCLERNATSSRIDVSLPFEVFLL